MRPNGALTITKAISIVNDGAGTANILAPASGTNSGAAIIINAGPGDTIRLRGLTIEGSGVGGSGVLFTHGASLTIENCAFRHLYTDGITFIPFGTANLAVSNTLVADNGSNGVYIGPQALGAITAVLDRVQALRNANSGFFVNGQYDTGGTVNVTVSDSVAANNADGIVANTTSFGAATTVTVVHTVISNNGTGIENLGGTVRVGQSTITGNANGWQNFNSGVFQSYGDNYIDGNAAAQGFPAGIPKK